MRQSSLRVQLSIQMPARLELERADRWMQTYFDTTASGTGMVAGAEVPLSLQLTPAFALLGRVMAMYGILCDACNLPCTVPGQLERLVRRADRWDFSLLVPATNGLSPQVFEELVRLALQLIDVFMKTVPSLRAAEGLYKQLDLELLPRYRQNFSEGRANAFVAALAHKLGVPFSHLGMGIMQLGYGARAQTTHRSACRNDSAIGARACSDKFFTALLLRQTGLPAPLHELVSTEEQALKVANTFGWPVVIKPADRERGEGVTVSVDGPDALTKAFRTARNLSNRILVEKQVPGLCHRIFVAGGRLVFATGRQPKSVVGDGMKTIRELVDEANHKQVNIPPWRRKKIFPLDELAIACLSNAGLSPESIPRDGQRVVLRPIENTEWGGISEDATTRIHPENVRLALRAANVLGLSVAGVDLMTVDIARPWYENQAVIIEMNFKPYLSGDLKKDMLHPYIVGLVSEGGRIPIHAVIGTADLWAIARDMRGQLMKQGIRAHITGHALSESADGEQLHLTSPGLFMRCIALLRSPEVEALVVVVDSDEFLETGLPVDRLDSIHTAGEIGAGSGASLLKLLSQHLGVAT